MPVKITQENGAPTIWRRVFELAMDHFDDDQELDTCKKHFTTEIYAPLLVCEIRPTKMELSSSIRRVTHDLPLSIVRVLRFPACGVQLRNLHPAQALAR
jgi:hypothetical protein